MAARLGVDRASRKGGELMLHERDLPASVRKVIKGGKRIQSMTAADVNRVAAVVAALLLDTRELKPSDAKRVLRRALAIV